MHSLSLPGIIADPPLWHRSLAPALAPLSGTRSGAALWHPLWRRSLVHRSLTPALAPLSGALLSGRLQDLLPKLQHKSDYTAHDLDAPELHTHRISSVPTQHTRSTVKYGGAPAREPHSRQCGGKSSSATATSVSALSVFSRRSKTAAEDSRMLCRIVWSPGNGAFDALTTCEHTQ